MKKFGIIALAGIVLSSCSAPMSITERCESYGYKPGTDEFRDCYADEQRAERIIAETRKNSGFELSRKKIDTGGYKPSAVRNGVYSHLWD